MSYMNKIIASSKPSAMKMVGQVTKAASKAKEIDQAYRKEAADAKKDPEYLKMMADKPAPTKKKKGKGIRLVGHHETGGQIQNYESQLDDAYSLYKENGIKFIKTGYVNDVSKNIKRINTNLNLNPK